MVGHGASVPPPQCLGNTGTGFAIDGSRICQADSVMLNTRIDKWVIMKNTYLPFVTASKTTMVMVMLISGLIDLLYFKYGLACISFSHVVINKRIIRSQ